MLEPTTVLIPPSAIDAAGDSGERGERQEARAIEDLRAAVNNQIETINSIPDSDLPADKKAEMIARLRGALNGGNITTIGMVLAEITKDVRMAQDAEATRDMLASGHLYDLDQAAWNRIYARSAFIDFNDAQSVRAFAEALMDDDVPEQFRASLVNSTARMLVKDPVASQAAKDFNNLPWEIKIRVNADMENARSTLANIAEENPAVSDQVTTIMVLGQGCNPEVKKVIEALVNEEISASEANAIISPINNIAKDKISESIESILPMLPENIRERVENISKGNEDIITEMAIKALKEKEKNPSYQMTPDEEAATRAFLLARGKEILKLMGENGDRIERGAREISGTANNAVEEKPDAYVERRVNLAVEFMVADNPSFANDPRYELERMARVIINQADAQGMALTQLGGMPQEIQNAFMRTAYEEAWGQLTTASGIIADGAAAILSGDAVLAESKALSMGRGTKNTLEKLGISPESAQEIGAVVTSTLKAGAIVGVASVESYAAAIESVNTATALIGNSINAAMVAWNTNDDIVRYIAEMKGEDIVKGEDGKNILRLTGNAKHDVAEIKSVLAKAGVSLPKFDADGSGSLNGDELSAAINAACVVYNGQLQPGSTPNIVAGNQDNAAARS